MEPSVVLYDEPTTGLDPIIADTINELIVRLQERLSITSVVVTHDMRSAFMVADRIAMLSDGSIRFIGTAREIEEAEDPVVKEFLSHR
jgi:phospholipid/cholesterol/gamma-HCH transport system ATP-binding protein